MAKVLGKGLKALIKTYEEDSNVSWANVSINNIVKNKYQPRKNFPKVEMQELIKSIKEKGIIQPLAVRKISNNQFELIAGERRLRAADKLNLNTVPVYIVDIKNESDMMEYALIENIQRVNLNPIEEAKGYLLLKDKYDYSQEEIASSVSKSRSEVANKMRLLNLPSIIQDALQNNTINYAHARALVGIKEIKRMIVVFNVIIDKNLSVRQADYLIKNFDSTKKNQPISLENEKELASLLQTSTKINISKSGKGYIKIFFKDYLQLQKIINKIKK